MTSMSHDVISTPLFYLKENIHSHAQLHYITTFLRVLERFPQLSTVHNYRHLHIYCPGYRERNFFEGFLLIFYHKQLYLLNSFVRVTSPYTFSKIAGVVDVKEPFVSGTENGLLLP